MQLTNRLGLPSLLVDAIRNDTYDSGWRPEFGDKYLTCTSLCRPPQLTRLLRQHAAELSEDASERIWSLQGQSVHSIIERAAAGRTDVLAEKRLYAQIAGWTIGGQVDLFELDSGSLSDWKVTSCWSVIDQELKLDWQLQLSILSWLLHKNGYEVQQASIVAILRDWSRTKAKFEKHGNYPQEPARVLPMAPWSLDLIETWIEHRLGELEAEEPRACTDDETWLSKAGWAAKKRGNKRATKLFETYDEAEAWVLEQADSSRFEIEGREGERRRCESYCPVRSFCRQAQGESQVM